MTEIKIDSLFFPNDFLSKRFSYWHVHLQHNPLPCAAQPVAEDSASHQVNGILMMYSAALAGTVGFLDKQVTATLLSCERTVYFTLGKPYH
jgi:hypothetical protein